MHHKLLFFLSLSISFLSSITTQSCQKVQCGPISEINVCVSPSDSLTTMQSCPSDKECKIPSEDPIDKALCGDKSPKAYIKYPGMQCEKDDECANKVCDQSTKTCKTTNEGEECTMVEQCAYGKTCRANDEGKKVCQSPAKDQEKCTVDTDCDIEHGCYNGKCTHYYTLIDEQYIGTSTGISNVLSLCQSGFSDENGICQTLKQKQEKTLCDDATPCQYEFNGKMLTIPENCLCGYNRDGAAYCKLGSGDDTYMKYIEKLKKYYFIDGKCHLAERGGDGCAMDLVNGDANIKKQLQLLYNAKVEALYNNRIYDADQCALTIELPDYVQTQPITKCAVYKCEAIDTQCAASTYDLTSSSISVKLSNICKKPETCVSNPNSAFYVKEDTSFVCQNKTVSNTRLPGEQCDSDSDCMQTLVNEMNRCVSNKCSGFDEGHECLADEQCLVGLYCGGGKCQKQKAMNADCENSYECNNNLLCYNKKCIDVIHSIEAGQSLSSLSEKDKKIKEKYCEFGQVYEDKCVELKGNNEKEEEFVKCNYGDYCSYTVIGDKEEKIGTIERPCECGFNAEGQGYCPKFHDYKRKEWQKYYSTIRDNADNKCHTKSRFDCYIKDEGNENLISEIKNKVIKANLFYGAVECAESVLSSGFLQLSLISVGAFVLALI